LGHPFAFGGRRDEESGLRAPGKHRRKSLPVGVDTLMEYLTGFGEDANPTLLFVHINANIFHGWSPVCGTDRVDPLWSSMLPRQGDQPLHLIYLRKAAGDE
jgi:hypothetical protein